jgi:hypothetical protein
MRNKFKKSKACPAKLQRSGGFTALISVIIISAVLLLISSTLSLTGFSGRLNILDSEYKERSLGLAEACMDVALLNLTKDPTYTGGTNINVATNNCEIRSLNPVLNPIIIETRAIFQNAVTNLRVRVNRSDLTIISWQEIPNF